MTTTRTLGRSGIEVSAIGMGCWAIGGPLWGDDGQPFGWGEVDDDESIRAIHRALDLGVTFFDTASNYGAGHSERVLGRALAGRRDERGDRHQVRQPFDEADPAGARRGRQPGLRACAAWRARCAGSAPTTSTSTSCTSTACRSRGARPGRHPGGPGRRRARSGRTAGAPTTRPRRPRSPTAGAHCAADPARRVGAARQRRRCSRSATRTTWPASTGGRWRWGCSPASTTPRPVGARRRARPGPGVAALVHRRPADAASGRRGSTRSATALTADGRTLAQGALGWLLARSPRRCRSPAAARWRRPRRTWPPWRSAR